MELSDIDLIELNEAFAAQGLAVIRELGFDEEITNEQLAAMVERRAVTMAELMEIDGMDEERAGQLIMTARAPWFAESAESAE